MTGFNRQRAEALRTRVPGACIALLRIALSFSLAFGTVLWAQTRLADDALAAQDRQLAGQASSKGSASSSSSAASSSAASAGASSSSAASSGAAPAAGESSDAPTPQLHIMDIAVFENGTTANAYAYASRAAETRDKVCAVIEQRGGRIDFDAGVEWNDETWEYESNKVTWSMAPGDEAIARITPAGVLEAAGTEDGTVTVCATVSGDYTADGAALSAVFLVELRGQTDTKYVTNIAICDDTGKVIDPSYRFEEGTLATAMLELQAKVTVFDPAASASRDYQVTPASGLAAQTGGEVSDILWESGDTRLGSVSEEGIYRPLVEGTNIVHAYSNAGFNGQRIAASATIDMPGEESGDYHPQDKLTVKVYYEDYPDQAKTTTYSIADLEAMGTSTYTYTALRGTQGFFTTTGRGPLLKKVLEDAGANTEGIARLKFGTPDNYQGVVSWDMLVDADRYYFPNIDANSYAGKVQVPPIIAIESHRNVGTDTLPNYDMDDQRRFLLLFGAKDTGETTTNLQVYNIHTLYVEQEGAPPVQPGHDVWTVKFVDSVTRGIIDTKRTSDPEGLGMPTPPAHDGYTFEGWNKSVDNATRTVTYTAVYRKDESSSPSGPASSSEGSPSSGSSQPPGSGPSQPPDAPGQPQDPDPSGNSGGASQPGGTVDLIEADGRDAGSGTSQAVGTTGGQRQESAQAAQQTPVMQLSPSDVQVVSHGRWSMLQAINRHPANIEDLMFNNPFAPYAAPTAAGVFAAGGLETFVRFRWQKRTPKVPGTGAR